MPQFTPTHLFSARWPKRHRGGLPSQIGSDAKRPGSRHFQGRRRGKAGAQGHVARQHPFPAAQAIAGVLQAPGRAFQIFDPAGFGIFYRVEGEFAAFLVVDRMHDHLAVVAGLECNPHGPIDGQGKNKPVVVIGVLADQIHPARGADDPLGLPPEFFSKMPLDIFFFDCHGSA